MHEAERIARSYMGTPFVHQGRTPGVALDCAGLVICVGKELGCLPADFDMSDYDQEPDKTSIVDACDLHLIRIPREQAQPGDVIVIAWDRWPQHLGIMGVYAPAPSHRTLIHAFMREGEKPEHKRTPPVVREHRLAPELMKKIVRAYRFPEVA